MMSKLFEPRLRWALPKMARWHWLFLVPLAVLVLGGISTWLSYHAMPAQAAPAPASASIVGAWLVEAQGAPFVPHVALFHADGTLLIDNPEAGDPHSSDSLGVGAWMRDPHSPRSIVGTFEEINADRTTGHYASRLVVTFTLTLASAQAFTGPAQATYYNLDGSKQNKTPYPATLTGTRIQP